MRYKPRHLLVTLVVAVVIVDLGFSGYLIPSARGAGSVYMSPSNYQAQPTGTNITFSILVSNMPHFKTYDVYIESEPSVLLPESVNVTGSTLITLSTELANCINGHGTGCTSYDGPGVVHSSLTTTWPPPVDTIIVGLLFTATFKVQGTPGTFLHIFNDTIVDSATNLPIPHTTSPGVYGAPGEFEFSSTPTLVVPLSGSNQTTVSVMSLNGFSGIVNLNATIPPPASYFLNVSIAPNHIHLDPSGPATFTLSVTSEPSRGASPGTYGVAIAGSSGLVSNVTSISILIPEVFLLYTVHYPLETSQGSQVTLQNAFQNLGVHPVRVVGITLGYDFGTFILFSAQRAGFTICGAGYTGAIDVNGQTSRQLSLEIPANTPTGNHTFTITVAWQYQQTMVIYNNPVDLWCDTDPIIVQKSTLILAGPSNPPLGAPGPLGSVRNATSALIAFVGRAWPYALGVYLAISVSLVMAVFFVRRRTPNESSRSPTISPHAC